MDKDLEARLNYLIANNIWKQIAKVTEDDRGVDLKEELDQKWKPLWDYEPKQMDLKQNPEQAKEVGDYFLSLYQKMGQKILDNPSFILTHDNLQENWNQLLSPESLTAKEISYTVRKMVEHEPALKQNLQEYMENQIKEQIQNGNKALELGYLFAQEAFSPENRAFMKEEYENGDFVRYDLHPSIVKAVRVLLHDPEIDLPDPDNSDAAGKVHSRIGDLYIEEKGNPEYRLKTVLEEEQKRQELIQEEQNKQKILQEEQKIEQNKQRILQEEQKIEQEMQGWRGRRNVEDLGFTEELELPDDNKDLFVPLTSESIQTYFSESLKNLRDDDYKENPKQYIEQLMKMQLLESQGLISDKTMIATFEREKRRLFQLEPDMDLMEKLMIKKENLYKALVEKTEREEILDYQIGALNQLTKGSLVYEWMEYSNRLLLNDGKEIWQHLQTEQVQHERINMVSDMYKCFDDSLSMEPERVMKILDQARQQNDIFVEVLGKLDRSDAEKQKRYEEDKTVRFQVLDGIKHNAEKWLEEEANKNLTVPVTEKSLKTYFSESLKNLQDDDWKKDPERYAERLIKMQFLENQNFISDQNAKDAFENEKKRIFQLMPNEKLMEILAEKKAELYQKRGETEQNGKNTFEALDYQIEALEKLTRESTAYVLVEAGMDLSAYPLFEKGMQGYQSQQTEEVKKEKIKLLGDKRIVFSKQKPEVRNQAVRQVTAFVDLIGTLDQSEEDRQKTYFGQEGLYGQILDGVKVNAENWLKEKQQEKQQEKQLEQEQNERERQFNRHVSEEELFGGISEQNENLKTVVDNLSKSVRKGIFGEKKENSREYDTMVEALDALLEDPIRKKPTPKQREDISQAYRLCQDYVALRTGAKTSEGKNRLNQANEAIKILEKMYPNVKKEKRAGTQNRQKISFQDLEHEAGHDRGRVAVHREVSREREPGRERKR